MAEPNPKPSHPNGLAFAMRRAKMDAAQLARQAKMSEADIADWEEGRQALPPAVARTLAAHLRTSANDVMFGLSYDHRKPDPVLPIEEEWPDESKSRRR